MVIDNHILKMTYALNQIPHLPGNHNPNPYCTTFYLRKGDPAMVLVLVARLGWLEPKGQRSEGST